MRGMRSGFACLLSAAVVLLTANPASACRIPWRFVPANETHEVVLVATAVSRVDWGQYVYDTGQPLDRDTGIELSRMHAREWTAVLRTVTVLKGDAPQVIQVTPDLDTFKGEVIISSCWDGITTPQPGQTYAVYLDERDGALRTTRLVDLEFSLVHDPLFSTARSGADRD